MEDSSGDISFGPGTQSMLILTYIPIRIRTCICICFALWMPRGFLGSALFAGVFPLRCVGYYDIVTLSRMVSIAYFRFLYYMNMWICDVWYGGAAPHRSIWKLFWVCAVMVLSVTILFSLLKLWLFFFSSRLNHGLRICGTSHYWCCNCSPPGMLLSLYLLLEYWVEHTIGTLYGILVSSNRIFYR